MTKDTGILRSILPRLVVAGALLGLIGLFAFGGWPSVSAQSQSNDATLSGLTLSDVDFGTFASGTTSYTASVANRVRETTVVPTMNHSGANSVIKLGGVDDDGTVSLSVGSNVITIEVTAEDGQATQTYTVTVTRAENSLPTGVPTISGTAQVGQTLTVDTSGIADEDGLTNALFGGTWSADEGYLRVLIAPGQDLSYTVSHRDVGMTLDVQVNFKDDAGETHFLESANTAVVAATSPAAPENFVAAVTNSGDVNLSWEAPTWDLAGEVGGDQTWGDGGSPITGYVVQWKEESDSWNTGGAVSEATVTGITHTIQSLTGGTEYTTRVIAVNSVGRGTPSDEATVTVTGTVNMPPSGVPTINGTAQVGQTLTANTSGISDADGLTNVSYSYQWLADNNEISGATSSTYTLQASDNGKVIKVRITFTDDGGNDESLTSVATAAVTGVQGPANTAPSFTSATADRNAVEGTVAGENIGGPVAATDADQGDTLTYTLSGTDAASFDMDRTTGQLMTTAASAALATGTYHVTVRVDDGKGGTDTIAVTITVTELGSVVSRYDADNDGSISRLELMAAIRDFLFPADPSNPVVTRDEVLELIRVHLFG